MEIAVQLTHKPIAKQRPPPDATAGAWVEFRGVVRGEEAGQPIAAIEYESYSPMAEREIRRLLTELAADKPCLAARVIHRLGVVPVGEAAIYVGIAGRHRAEAFALLAGFMDRLKVDVPIWKRRAVPLAPLPEPATSSAATALDEVLARVRSLCEPLAIERVELARAVDRVLREPVCAPEDQPAFDRSAVDGFALRVDDLAQEFRIVDRLRAGDWRPRELACGEAVQIATGGALPASGLQVVMKEDARVTGDRVQILRREATRYVRLRGEDCRAGDPLVAAGARLSPGGVGLLASLGGDAPVGHLPATRAARGDGR
jgi:molybdopterin synthase catalytic subunit